MISLKAILSTQENTSLIDDTIMKLLKKEVLVGVPENEDVREEGEMGNAALAYIHDNGSPVAGIPARPFMTPVIRNAQDRINTHFLASVKAQIENKPKIATEHLEKAGMIAQNSIRKVINEGEGFAPLKRSTKLGRLRRRKSAESWSEEKREEVMESFHPLVDTGQLRDSITYQVVRKK